MSYSTPRSAVLFRRARSSSLAAGGLLLSLGLATSPTTAQVFPSNDVALIGRLAPAGPGVQYSDVWGFVDPATGKEYALLCSRLGVHVIDCSNPDNPVARALIPTEAPGDLNQWRDAKVFGRYAYSVAQAYAGLQIIDLLDPDNAFKIELWGVSRWTGAHNLMVDEERGHLWVLGTDTGTHILDIGTNPRAPKTIYVLPTPYSFDVRIQGDHAYYADLFGNALLIYDVTDLPQSLPLVSFVSFPGTQLAHSAWPTRDGNFLATANEAIGGPVGIFDISNKALPQLVSTWVPDPIGAPEAIPHHIYVRDRLVHVSHWTEGYRVLDLSDPQQPLEVGFLDTYLGPERTGFKGAWGAYVGLPSGRILIGDTIRGLFVLKPRATPVRYGVATADATNGGTTPHIHSFGAAYLGNPRYAVQVDDAPVNTPGVFILGSARASIPLLGATVNVSLSAPKVSITMGTSAAGDASIPLPLPNMPTLDGVRLRAQFLFLGPGGFRSATEGIEIDLFGL